MTDVKISALGALDALADTDELPIVDKSDTTGAASGTTKRVTGAVLRSGVTTGVVRVQFDLAGGAAHSEGQIQWDDDAKTLVLDTEVNGVKLSVGQEQQFRARNKTGATILNGAVIYVNGASGSRPTVALASAATEGLANRTLALATHDIANNNTGRVTDFGLVRDLDTSAFLAGDELYLSDTAGAYSTTPGAVRVRIGTVLVSNATTGVVLVHINREILGPVQDADFSANGLMTRTAEGAYTSRSLEAGSSKIVVSNGDGVAGNPSVDVGTLLISDIGDTQSTQVLTAATETIGADADYLEISTAVSGGLALTSVPSIASPSGNRRMMILHNDGAEPVEVQDRSVLVGSGIDLGQTSGVIKPSDYFVVYWDSSGGYWAAISHPNQPVGVPTRIDARNTSGSTIAAGTPVTPDGWNVGQDRTNIIAADAASGGASPSIGLIDGALGNNQSGTVVTFGPITGLDTSAWNEGDVLYLASGGGLTNTRPQGAARVQGHALVLRSSASGGVLFVYNSGRYSGTPNFGAMSPTVVSVTGTAKTLAATDEGTQQHCNNASAQTITVPLASTVAFAVGTQVGFVQVGAGAVSITGDMGVSINGTSGGSVTMSGQYKAALLINIGADSWIVSGSAS